MAKTWNNPIDKNVDWGGDASTGGLPVSGEMVQKFIKESLDGKAGLFYYDTANNRYLVFTDEQSKEAYLADPTQTSLIIAAFDAPFNYTAEIHLATPTYNAIFAGATGNYIDFTFDVKNKQGASTGESVVITYTIIRNATKQTFSQVARYGEAIRFNVDKYLAEGLNTVIVGVTGQTTLAATTASITYQVVNLQLTDELDISAVYDLTDGAKTLEVPFTVKGAGTKVVEWYLDGVQLDFVKNEDEVVDVEAQRVKNITLANLQQGRHALQFRAYTTVNGEKFYTPTLYRDVMVYTGASSDTIIGLAMEIPVKYGLAGATPALYGITQYVPYTLRFATYSPTNKLNIPVTITVSRELLGTVSSNNGIVNEFGIVAKTAGNKNLSLAADEVAYDIAMLVEATSMALEEITSELKLDFSAIGKNNNSADRDSWSYGGYTGAFVGFNWNAGSGWSDNRLKINDGAAFSINYAPLAGSPTTKGRTLEFEFKTTNVNDDDAVICDLRNDNGVGLLITATKVSLMSEAGVVVENEFKANEEVRIGIVINRASGSSRRGLSMIYANGCMSRCENWEAGDSYESDAQISFIGSAGAEIELKAIRIYEAALSDDNMLNNYTLYRDTVAEMQEVYDRNDVYVEGTTTFSPDKMVSRLPVMIVTGNIPELENTSDKNKQIVVDVEYTDMQDPTRSFKMIGAAMRPQGTSSMGYPKKNFRIYTQELESTILCDAEGKIVADKLYSFKQGAIPVNCWCLKADYAESSGTHNTGIARMWNKALFDMQIDGEYVCRTDAQKAALESGYPYDVRTTIDGFPILLFYRRNANDEPIFIGKYNFNNDKSTEAVFGFTGIPGFDNSRMQCWEILNNGNPLALFQTIDGFDTGWKEAYESRYPDTKTPNLTDLKAFSTWMVGVNGDHARFATEKWQHFKVYPMAAYYCYLMRHAAADQLVKNAMLTSEDGEKFYFILYDNDTINGLNNIGEIDLLPTDDRNSVDASGQFKFAGHSSVLWNMLEADEEFMQIVKDVDNALYSAGISYNECIRMFDEEQAEKWVERVYNQDSEYKYVGPYVNSGINNLEMLQGRRDLHRRWWLSKRFSIYDAKFVSGEYKSQAVELKCMNDTPAGQSFSIKAGYPLDYGYGINNVPRETGVTLAPGESHTFTTAETVNLGDPIRIYGSPNIQELDLSAMANRLATISVANVYTEALGTRLEKLIIGGDGVNNVEVSEISGLKMAKKLTHLNIMGMKGLKALDLTSQPYFEKLSAVGSEIASVSFAKGAPVTRLELPTTMKALNLEQLPYLTAINLVLADITGIHTISVKGCPNLANDFSWVNNWYNRKSTVDSKCTLIMDNVNWTGATADDLVNLAKIGTLDLKGKVVLESITLEQINVLLDAFGESAFDRNSDFYIDAPDAVFISGRAELLEGESERYLAIVFGAEVQRVTWEITSGSNSYVTIDANTGLLEVADGYGNGTIGLRANVYTNEGRMVANISISIRDVIYPTQNDTYIVGNSQLENELEIYTLEYPSNVTGRVYASWSLTGLDEYAVIDYYNDNSCAIKKLKETDGIIDGVITCIVKKGDGAELFSITKSVTAINSNIAETDAGVCAALFAMGLCANENYITKAEAALVTEEDLDGSNNSASKFAEYAIKNFNGFRYFVGLTTLPPYCFASTTIEEIHLPDTITEIEKSAFNRCGSLRTVVIPYGVVKIGRSAFINCKSLKSIELPETLINISDFAFSDCSALSTITINAPFAPIISESSVSGIGTDTALSGTNRLYVPVNAENYDSSYWQSVLCNPDESNFTLVASLPYVESPYAELDSGVCEAFYAKGLCARKDSITKEEAAAITAEQLSTANNASGSVFSGYAAKIKTFNGFKHFIKVTKIPHSLFYDCKYMTSIKLPSSVEVIDTLSFAGCLALKSIEIGANVRTIGAQVFYQCLSMSTIICYPASAPSAGAGTFGSNAGSWVGRNTYNTGANMLYVPMDATGYETGEWLNPLCNSSSCGFTLSKTL